MRLPAPWLAGSAFLLGFLAHLVGDLPTPASVWGGIQAFWPLPDMVGGWGLTWWWNNYDRLLILLIQLAILLALFPFRARVRAVRAMTGVVLVTGALLLVRQLLDRETSYTYTGNTPRYAALESASLAEQRRILPDPLYGLFRQVDGWMPVPF